MSRGRAARLVIAFAIAFAGAFAVLSAFGDSRSGGGWMFLASMAAPLFLAVALGGRGASAGFVLAIGFAAVLGLFTASLPGTTSVSASIPSSSSRSLSHHSWSCR